MLSIVLLLCMTSVMVSGTPEGKVIYDLDDAEVLFEEFISHHNRQYANEIEKQERFKMFLKTLDRINAKNENSEDAVFAINHFSDLTMEEFLNYYANLKVNSGNVFGEACDLVTKVSTKTAPESFDWRDKNMVTHVKDQGFCGSCWAFSAIGSLESQYAIQHDNLVELSEQQLVDCDNISEGCNGGLMTNAFLALKQMGGAETEKYYPYKAMHRNCIFNKTMIQAKVDGCYQYNLTDEDQLKEILYTKGPISIGLDASDFISYDNGILTSCAGDSINHGVLLVGYGNEKDTPFWIIKNSWSTIWGEKGYIRIKRGINACGLINDAMASPIVG